MSEVLVERAPGTFDARWGDALREIVGEPGRLVLHAQPIAELNSGSIAGFELLARFQGRWSAPPDLWFAAAEVHGYNAQLQTQVLRTAIAARADLPPNTFLTVNIDPHLLGHPSVVAALTNPGDLSRVVVELTEHSRMGAEAADVLRQVRALGGMVAMDDAGTGYAGLSTMLTLRPHIVNSTATSSAASTAILSARRSSRWSATSPGGWTPGSSPKASRPPKSWTPSSRSASRWVRAGHWPARPTRCPPRYRPT